MRSLTYKKVTLWLLVGSCARSVVEGIICEMLLEGMFCRVLWKECFVECCGRNVLWGGGVVECCE